MMFSLPLISKSFFVERCIDGSVPSNRPLQIPTNLFA